MTRRTQNFHNSWRWCKGRYTVWASPSGSLFPHQNYGLSATYLTSLLHPVKNDHSFRLLLYHLVRGFEHVVKAECPSGPLGPICVMWLETTIYITILPSRAFRWWGLSQSPLTLPTWFLTKTFLAAIVVHLVRSNPNFLLALKQLKINRDH